MIKELSWYLESGRFSGVAEELEGSLRKYEEAKKAGGEGDNLNSLREDARALFEDHSVRSGLRGGEAAYINIDAEFFIGNTLDENAMNSFIKNIIKGHCYQKVMWTYMGTTGLFTAISKSEMAKAGLRYEDYLPLEYKKNCPAQKPLEETAGKDTQIFYQYGDGTVSTEYVPEKAKLKFNMLEDTSGVDWKAGYDPNGGVKKAGWHGDYDHNGNWVRVNEQGSGNLPVNHDGMVTLELIRDGDSAILYDPGMLLLASPLLLYTTESGEPYGELSMDRERTVKEIDESLKKMGVTGIKAVGGIEADKPELLAAYREILGSNALPELQAMEGKKALAVREAREQDAAASVAEGAGIKLEKKLRVAGRHGGSSASVLAAVADGSVMSPLSPRKTTDGLALGLSEEETVELSAATVKAEYEELYDAALSNMYASWSYYAGAASRLGFAELVRGYLEGTEGDKTSEAITAQTTLGEIINGSGEAEKDGVSLYSSGIPGVFSEPETVDFCDEAAKERYVQSLERKRILPKGGAVAALSALKAMPEGNTEQKAELNRRLTRAFGEYKAISMSTGMPIGEIISAAKGENASAMGRKVYYELPVPALITSAAKENRQKREVRLEEAADNGNEVIVIGGVNGPALDEVLLTRETLKNDYAFSEEEADKAQSFLHGIRLPLENPVVPPFLLETIKRDKINTAGALRKSILQSLSGNENVSYNLAGSEGLRAYAESGRSKVSKNEVQTLLQEELKKSAYRTAPSGSVEKVKMKYRDGGAIVPFVRNSPKGFPERIHLAMPGGHALGAYEGGTVRIPSAETMYHTFAEDNAFEHTTASGSFSTGIPTEADVEDTPLSDVADYQVTEGSKPVVSFPKKTAMNAELERLRKIEANYEKDKASLARQKQPVLARSESHDVGHARGASEIRQPKQFLWDLSDKVVDRLKRKAGS
ncbi:MAG: hypothetical protein LBI28_03720 [Treponema sp.]|jgi:hypothetical protein|nr:hypothetical protein [Treponema sp.]